MLAVSEGPGAWGLRGPLPTSLPWPEGEAGSKRHGLRPHAPGALGWACPAARNLGSCHPQAFDVTEMETHTRLTIN